MKNKNSKFLKDFIKYCSKHPELRFWQALSDWTEKTIRANDDDTFYFEGKEK